MKRSFGLNAAFDIMRLGKRYRLKNYGEVMEFEVVDILDGGDYILKTIDTLEIQNLSDLVKFGVGRDFEFGEL
jgi:hypothetical protein